MRSLSKILIEFVDSSCRTVVVSGRLAIQCKVSDWHRYQEARDAKHSKLVDTAMRNAQKHVSVLFIWNQVDR